MIRKCQVLRRFNWLTGYNENLKVDFSIKKIFYFEPITIEQYIGCEMTDVIFRCYGESDMKSESLFIEKHLSFQILNKKDLIGKDIPFCYIISESKMIYLKGIEDVLEELLNMRVSFVDLSNPDEKQCLVILRK